MPDRTLLLRQDLELVEDLLLVFTHEKELHELDDVLSAKGKHELVNTKRMKDLLAEVAKLSDEESDNIFSDFPWLIQFVALKEHLDAERRRPTPTQTTPEPTPESTPEAAAAAISIVTETPPTPPTERATPPPRPKKRSSPHGVPRRSPRLKKTPRRSPRINRNRRR